MITLSASGGSVTFEFSGNSTYLNDGQITVPVNSLALIIDESDMATFRKAASNDIFVSANIAEFGMTKAELESWYKANMVGATGGGSGSGVTPSEVQTMIDESISGKANSSDVYTTGQTSGATEIANALNAKLDTTTYTAYTADTTPKVDAAWQKGVIAPSLYYDITSGITLSSLPISGGNYNYTSIATDDSLKSDNEGVLGVYATGDTYVVSINPTEKINVTNLGADKKPFNIKMYWNSSYTGNTSHYIAVRCTVNDDTNGYCQWDWKNGQYVPNTSYINTAVTLTYDSINQVVTITPSSSSALTSIHYVRCNRYIAPASALTQDDCRIGLVTIETNLYKLQEALDNKVDTSAIATSITSGDTNPVAGGAVYDKVHVTSGESSETVLIFEERTVGSTPTMVSTNYPSGATIVKLDINNVPSYLGYFGWYGADESFLGGAKITQDGGNIGVDFNYSGVKPISGTTSYTDNVLTVEVTGFQNASLSDIAYFSHDLMSTYNSIKAVKTSKEYWIKEYVDAQTSILTEEISAAVSGKTNQSDFTAYTASTDAALSGKQDTLSAGTGIEISGNVISATGGGSLNISISGGSGNFSIQENGGTALGDFSHAEGSNTMTTPSAIHSHAEGESTVAGGKASHTEGANTTTINYAEHASGRYNKVSISSATFGDSGNTLFTVGNGTSSADTHNAFEIRQNGDIYFEYDGSDIKLQDKLDEIETVTAAALNNLNDRVSEDEEVTAAALNNLNDRFGGLSLVKLTQTEYDNLQTKDSNTLYVIVN